MRCTGVAGVVAALAVMGAMPGPDAVAAKTLSITNKIDALGGLRYSRGPAFAPRDRRRSRPTPSKRRRMNPKHAARRARHARKARAS